MTLYALIFTNLGERQENELSAYSVFNKGFTQLLGTLSPDQFENEIRNRTEISDTASFNEFEPEDFDEDDEKSEMTAEETADVISTAGDPHHLQRNSKRSSKKSKKKRGGRRKGMRGSAVEKEEGDRDEEDAVADADDEER